MFTHSTETIIWAKKRGGRHYFNYNLMLEEAGGSQMTDVWVSGVIKKFEKRFGFHPTQKPIEIITRIILCSTKPGMLVVDPFLGSGTTAVVCEKFGRRCIGIDLKAEFLETARRRIEALKNE